MADWDAATASAVAALVVAVVALFVAIAQATQQYLITGQLIRLCDSVVFGPMPGRGRRVWQFSQFRFRVIYSVPQISLAANLWPSGGAHSKSHAIGQFELPSLADTDADVDADAEDATSLEPLSSPMARRARQLAERLGGRRILDWFRRKRGKPSDLDSVDDLSSTRSESVTHVSRFKLPIPLPAALRRRRRQPAPSSTYASSSYQASVVSRNGIPVDRPRERARGIIIEVDRSSSSSSSVSSSLVASPRRNSHVGEASWVSFCRAIEISCRHSVRIDLVEYDADRCPSDLISVPMQVSMRDIVIMALMAGMELTSASFEDKSISMQGAVGTLTSSNHAILGPILHFTPRNIGTSLPMAFGARMQDVYGKINRFWMPRTWDVCSVAGSFYDFSRRRTVRRLDDRWIRDKEGVESYGIDKYEDPNTSSGKKKRAKGTVHGAGSKADPSVGDTLKNKVQSAQVPVRPRNRNEIPDRRVQDGDWIIYPYTVPPPQPVMHLRMDENMNLVPVNPGELQIYRVPPDILKVKVPAEAEKHSLSLDTQEVPSMGPSGDQKDLQDAVQPSGPHIIRNHKPAPGPPPLPAYMSYPPPHRHATVEEAPDEDGIATVASSSKKGAVEISPLIVDVTPLTVDVKDDRDDERNQRPGTPPSERARLARERQDARAEKLRQIQEDKVVVDNVVKRGAMGSPYEEAEGMLRHSRNGGPLLLTNYAHFPAGDKVPAGPGPTTEEEAAHEREKMREKERRERDQERDERNRRRNRAVALTKVDMFWLCQTDVMSGSWATPWEQHLPISSALDGAVTVILEALLGFLDENSSLFYTDAQFLVQYSFKRTAEWMLQGHFTCPAYGHNARGGVIATGRYRGVRIACFESMIPALELLHSYRWQVDSDQHDQSENGEEQNVELMRLDAWLSYVGRVPEIAEGPHNLARQTPALVDLLMEEFEIDFQNVDLSAREGGLQDIQGLAANVMDFLTDEELTQPEQLYVLVALLRGVKAAQCVLAGSNTTEVLDILLKDVQAHLV
ncbi:hypothetical protein F5X97DRAFT_313669 [Nemania serpens]|nr:hypothetical protein F5X97DRAFT_313669 [Nemania serpens]